MYKTMIEARKPIKLVARLFKGPDDQWGVRPGAMVVATDKTNPNAEMSLYRLVDTSETRPTYTELVKWLEEKARQRLKEALQLDEQEAMKLVIESEIKSEP